MMRIAVDCRALFAGRLSPDSTRHISRSLATLVAEKPQVVFCLFSDTRPDHMHWPAPYQDLIEVHKSMGGRMGWALWSDWQVPHWARKSRSDGLLLTGGAGPARAEIPTILWMAKPMGRFAAIGEGAYRGFVRARISRSVRQAGALVAGCAGTQAWIALQFPDASQKTTLVHPAPEEDIAPAQAAQREEGKRVYAQGKEYFLLSAANAHGEELTGVLKSFSIFKKRLQSNMQLVITDTHTARHGGWLDTLTTYKYRGDVQLVSGPGPVSAPSLLACAYALIRLTGDDLILLNAFKAGVPVVDCSGEDTAALGGGAMLRSPARDQGQLAGQMILLYKDEALRSSLMKKAKIQVQQFSWHRSADCLWQAIVRSQQGA
jgi:hypothetical protein